jgi:2-polyprenyl-3-methyl-5-hydroxy-6-metoxy-1,4-benzoquinol methylase
METIRCIFCHRPQGNYLYTKSSPPKNYNIYKCDFCRSAFVWPRPEAADIKALYASIDYRQSADLQNNERHYHPDVHDEAGNLLRRCKELSHGKRFLDVGAGFGDFSKAAIKYGFSVKACEPNAFSREVFYNKNYFKPDPEMFDDAYATKLTSSFDVALATQVLEHIIDPDDFVNNIHRALCTEGLAAVSLPHYGSALSTIQGQNDMFITPPEHLNFFSVKGLTYLFKRHGFTLERIETSSKVNRTRLEKAVRLPILSTMAWVWLYQVLSCFDPFKMGMFINAYFRKSSV